MRLLFAITVFCFCAVLWGALWLTRRIRSTQTRRNRDSRRRRPGFTPEFFEAGEFRTPRALRLQQQIPWAPDRRHLSVENGPRHGLRPAPALLEAPSAPVLPFSALPAHTQNQIQTQALANESLSAKKGTIIPISPPVSGRILKTVLGQPSISPLPHRKPPMPARPHGVRRVDLSQYNRSFDPGPATKLTHGDAYSSDIGGPMGDLSDPYTHTARASGTQGPMIKTIHRP